MVFIEEFLAFICALLSFVGAVKVGVIEGNDLESFKAGSWVGANNGNSRHYDLPSLFATSTSLEILDSDIKGNGVWAVPPEISPDSMVEATYIFLDLNKFCNLSTATVSVHYFMHHAAAYLSPRESSEVGSNGFCYLNNPSGINWEMAQFKLISFDRVGSPVLCKF